MASRQLKQFISPKKLVGRKPMSEKQDDALDKKQGIKENSKKDIALDKKRGITEDKKKK